MDKKNKPLTTKQKLFFGVACWGVQSWNQTQNFKNNGYNQKYIDSKKAMYIGLAIYGLGIALFILILILIN